MSRRPGRTRRRSPLPSVRRGFRNLRQTLPLPAGAPKPAKPGPGRPPGSKNRHPATRHDVGKTVRRTTAKTKNPQADRLKNKLKFGLVRRARALLPASLLTARDIWDRPGEIPSGQHQRPDPTGISVSTLSHQDLVLHPGEAAELDTGWRTGPAASTRVRLSC